MGRADFTGFDLTHRMLAACAVATPGERAAAVGALWSATPDWDALERSADMHQLRPPLQACLERQGLARPEGGIARAAVVNRANALVLSVEVGRVLDALRSVGIRAVPFKGPVFAAIHDEGPLTREVRDLDVLVDEDDVGRAVATLEPLGYTPRHRRLAASHSRARRASELILYGARGRTVLELHWRLAPPWCPEAISAREVLDAAVERAYLDTRVLWPPAEELFLVHICDGMKSGGYGLRWLGDLAAILRKQPIDWTRVEMIARRNGGLASLRISLAVLEEVILGVGGDAPLALAPEARRLAREAHESPWLANAAAQLGRRLARDECLLGAMPHFRWAMRITDRPIQTAGAIARYCVTPRIEPNGP